MKLFLASVAAASLAVSSAVAADLPTRKVAPVAPMIAPVFTWTGFYAGVNGGYGFGDSKLKDVTFGADARDGFDAWASKEEKFAKWADKRSDGFTGGAQVGYNYQMGSVVLGVEADFSYANLSAKRSGVNAEKETAPGWRSGNSVMAGSTLNWFGTVRPRIGFVATGRMMVFATAGLAYGNVRNTVQFTDTLNGQVDGNYVGKQSKIRAGWTIGAGAEYALTDSVVLKGEYGYVDFGASNNKTYMKHNDPRYVSARDDLGFHFVRAGLNYRF